MTVFLRMMRSTLAMPVLATGMAVGATQAGPAWAESPLAVRDSFCGIRRELVPTSVDPQLHFFGHDDRSLVDSSQLPWRAVGLVVSSATTQCSGVLIDDDVLLTAAHCVTDANGRPVPSNNIQFYAGVRDRTYQATAAVVDIVVPGAYRGREGDMAHDWALLELATPIGAEIGYIEIWRPDSVAVLGTGGSNGQQVAQAGYSIDLPFSLSAHRGCSIGNVFANGTFAHDCDTLPGDSGSPLFLSQDGREYVVAIDVAAECDTDGRVVRNIAVDVRGFYEAYRSLAGRPTARVIRLGE